MPPGTQFVIGMHLDGEVLTGIYELDEEGEVVAELLAVGLAQELCAITFHYLGQCEPLVFSAHYNGLRTLDGRYDPSFRAPQRGLVNGIKL